MPRLELLACVLLSKLIKEVLLVLSGRVVISEVFCWSDSEVALCWIKGKEKFWRPWVENRVVFIRQVVDRSKWNHVAGVLNPADLPTRLSKLSSLKDECWWHGPLFLRDFEFKVDDFDVDKKLDLVDVVVESKKKVDGKKVRDKKVVDSVILSAGNEVVCENFDLSAGKSFDLSAGNEVVSKNVDLSARKSFDLSAGNEVVCENVDLNAESDVVDSVILSVVDEVEKCNEQSEYEIVNENINNIIDNTKFCSLKKLIMVTGYVLRFASNVIKRIKKKKELVIYDDMLTIEEYNGAYDLWVKSEQSILKKEKNLNKLTNSLKLFNSKDGFLRLKGRFENSSLTYDEKYPILLRGAYDSYFTKLIIWDAHHNVYHEGVESTLNFVRNKFWITKGRKSVKDTIKKCITCKRLHGKALIPPSSPDLPDFRVTDLMNSFQATGLDYAGPLFVKDNINSVSKVYILLLTCASSRAIHLELTPDMQVPAFLRGFKRFTARRGTPDLIINDNAKTFKSTYVKRYMIQRGVKQRFILPASPWWGGFYERLVRSVKSSLKKTLGKSTLSFEELQTILCEIEEVINSRPLVYVTEDDIDGALTPYHLMYGRNLSKKSNLFKGDQDVIDVTKQDCTKRVRYMSYLINSFWKRFSKTYLNELRQRDLYQISKNGNAESLVVGDIVLIKDEPRLPRLEWRIGKVEELIRGNDEKIRGAKLNVISKTGQKTVVHRPVQKLIPFEILSEQAQQTNIDEINRNTVIDRHEVDVSDSDSVRPSKRMTRKAAIAGQNLRRLRDIYEC